MIDYVVYMPETDELVVLKGPKIPKKELPAEVVLTITSPSGEESTMNCYELFAVGEL